MSVTTAGWTRRGFLLGALCGAAALTAACARDGEASDAAGEASADAGADGGADTGESNAQPDVDQVSQLVSQMDLTVKIAQLFMLTPEGLLGSVAEDLEATDSYGENGVVSMGEDLAAALEKYPVGGICLFGANIVGADQLRRLLSDISQKTSSTGAGVPALLGVDEEGGPSVARIANSGLFDVESFPSMWQIGEGGDASVAGRVGSTIGSYLRDIGFNLDFAPVADVLTNPDNQVIGSRSFGSDPELVAEMVSAEVKGFDGTGVLCCPKHFPGHGDTAGDSHTGAATSTRTRSELESCELVPFRAAVEAGAPMVMVGHISTPNATDDGLPASLSSEVIGGMLRDELGFDGVVVSDAMAMAAIADNYTSADAAIDFVSAGGDLILMPYNFPKAYQGFIGAVRTGRISEERLDESVGRILRAKQRIGLIPE